MLTSPAQLFMVTAPLALVAAGALLAVDGADLLASGWAPSTLALVHLGTLGYLALGTFGLVYAFIPGLDVPRPPSRRVSLAVYVLLLVGLASLVAGFLTGESLPLFVALTPLVIALPCFAVAVFRSLRAAPAGVPADALRIVAASCLLTVVIGEWMLHGHSGMRFPGPRPLWVQVHLGVALMGWIGGVFSALIPSPGVARAERAERLLLAIGVGLPPLVLLGEALSGIGASGPWIAAFAALPAATAVLLVQPARVLRAGSLGRDDGARARGAGLALAPGVALAAGVTWFAGDPRWNVVLGWLAIHGWAGLVLHGLLLQHTPGGAGARRPALGLGLHLSALAVGTIATLAAWDAGARLAGVLLAATGIWLAVAVRASPARVPPSPRA
ncbi:MAG: hypothetical protein JRG76_10140 [Deltaproteobacteria bacterium]|nr:hypothetical protein [Deltaproteobacteria bacterium]MBW2414855.1 hypothetical protein [Deltaproteobacteria bacterium]